VRELLQYVRVDHDVWVARRSMGRLPARSSQGACGGRRVDVARKRSGDGADEAKPESGDGAANLRAETERMKAGHGSRGIPAAQPLQEGGTETPGDESSIAQKARALHPSGKAMKRALEQRQSLTGSKVKSSEKKAKAFQRQRGALADGAVAQALAPSGWADFVLSSPWTLALSVDANAPVVGMVNPRRRQKTASLCGLRVPRSACFNSGGLMLAEEVS